MKTTPLMLVWLLAAAPTFSQPPVSKGLQWRWGKGSSPRVPVGKAPWLQNSLFEKDKKWGSKEWLIIGGGIALAVGIGILIAANSDGGGSSSNGGGY